MREHLFVNVLNFIYSIRRTGNNYELREASFSDAFGKCLFYIFLLHCLITLLKQGLKSMYKKSSADFLKVKLHVIYPITTDGVRGGRDGRILPP